MIIEQEEEHEDVHDKTFLERIENFQIIKVYF